MMDARVKPAHNDRNRGGHRMATRFAFRTAFSLVALIALTQPLAAQDWPRQPIRIVVGFGAGGGTDIAGGMGAQALAEVLGQPVVVENRVGAGGTTAAEGVARAPKDGYTALMMSNAHAVSAVMYKTLRYDPIADFQMVSMVGTAGLVMVTAPDFPGKDLKGVIAQAKAHPRKLHSRDPPLPPTPPFPPHPLTP